MLDAVDSGTQDALVIYMAYPGEKPILSGGRKVTDWTPYKDHIFQCDLPGTKGGHWKFRRLFADGRLQPRARWPQVDARDGGWARIEAPATPDSRIAFRYRPAAPAPHWAKPAEAEVNFFYGIGNDWGNEIIPIRTIDESRRMITVAYPARLRPLLLVVQRAVPRGGPLRRGERLGGLGPARPMVPGLRGRQALLLAADRLAGLVGTRFQPVRKHGQDGRATWSPRPSIGWWPCMARSSSPSAALRSPRRPTATICTPTASRGWDRRFRWRAGGTAARPCT